MFRKIRNWNKLVRFIKSEREKNNAYFEVNTTESEIIITVENLLNKKKFERNQLRLKY